MSYNKKALLSIVKKLDKAKAPGKPKDIFTDPMGQWKYPGQNTRIPSSDITMQGVNYPVWAQPNVGPGTMMQPGQDYQFPGADYVDEFPQGNNEDFYEDDLDEEQIAELRAGGYVVEDISVPQLTQAQKGTVVKDNIIYPPGDSEYMNQPALNYDIIEMLNQKARRDYEQNIKDKVDPTNLNRTSPRYQQEFMMNQGLIQAQIGGQKEGEVLDIPEMQAYADPNKRKQQNKLIDKARAIASTIEGRQALKQGNYKDFSIENMKKFIKSATDYKKEAEDYHKARRLVNEKKMDTDSFARRYNEKGWAKFDEATANENYEGEYQGAVDKANKKKAKNMGYTDAVLELTGAPALQRIAADPIGTAKGVGQTIGDLATLPYGVAEGAYNYATNGNFDMGTNTFGQKYGEGVNETIDVLSVMPAFAGVSKITDLATPALIKGVNKLGKTLPKKAVSSEAVDDLVDLWRIQEKGARPMSELAAEGKLGKHFQNEKAIKHFKDREEHFGQWFTKDKNDFDFYKADREFIDPEIINLQVPKSKLESFTNYNKSLSRAPDREFVIPTEEQNLYKVTNTPNELPSSPNSIIPEIPNVNPEQRALANKAMESTDLGGNNPIQIGKEPNPNPLYNIDPDDYDNMQQALTMGKEDAQQNLKRYFDNNVLSYKDPKFTSEYNAAKFKMETGLDQPGGPQIGTDLTKWRGLDKEDLFVPSVEDIKKYNLDQKGMVYPSHVRNETLISREQELDALNNVQQKALTSGDIDLANEYEKYIAKLKSDALKEYSKPYTADEALKNTRLNYSDPNLELANPEIKNEFSWPWSKNKNTAVSEEKLNALEDLKKKNIKNNVGQQKIETEFKNWKDKKISDLETGEGTRRLEKFINDNNLEMSTKNFIDKFKKTKYTDDTKAIEVDILNNIEKLNKVTDRIKNLETEYNNVLKNPQNYPVNTAERLDAEIEMLKDTKDTVSQIAVAGINNIDKINKTAYYEYGSRNLFVGDNYSTPQDLSKTLAHEGSHSTTRNVTPFENIPNEEKKMAFNTKMDRDLINELKLSRKPPEHITKELSMSEIENTPEGTSQLLAINRAKDPKTYWLNSKKYWTEGNKNPGQSNEPTSFIAELRSAMKEEGLIKNDYDPITEKMLKTYYANYIKKPSHHESLRVFDIMKNDKSNFKVLEKHINDLLSLAPYLIPTAIGTGAAMGSTNETLPQNMYGGDIGKLKKFIN